MSTSFETIMNNLLGKSKANIEREIKRGDSKFLIPGIYVGKILQIGYTEDRFLKIAGGNDKAATLRAALAQTKGVQPSEVKIPALDVIFDVTEGDYANYAEDAKSESGEYPKTAHCQVSLFNADGTTNQALERFIANVIKSNDGMAYPSNFDAVKRGFVGKKIAALYEGREYMYGGKQHTSVDFRYFTSISYAKSGRITVMHTLLDRSKITEEDFQARRKAGKTSEQKKEEGFGLDFITAGTHDTEQEQEWNPFTDSPNDYNPSSGQSDIEWV